jgi:hypothetical protein
MALVNCSNISFEAVSHELDLIIEKKEEFTIVNKIEIVKPVENGSIDKQVESKPKKTRGKYNTKKKKIIAEVIDEESNGEETTYNEESSNVEEKLTRARGTSRNNHFNEEALNNSIESNRDDVAGGKKLNII